MTVDELVAACAGIGVHVVFLPVGVAGGYVHDIGLIVIDSSLPALEQRAVLAHEYVHALHGHEGVQDKAVEARVDRQAAELLVSPAEYILAERLYGCDVAAIAEELELPVWVVAAYQTWLATQPPEALSDISNLRESAAPDALGDAHADESLLEPAHSPEN
ncbi:MAG: ImmA/IrrE family metallo-endopeptidase [Trueperella sp.]|uniref:ImmA/IrrE family metallo-endopeptidase n=1 Tax=Trueperella sp. TaxID=2699835 RepID=UPI0025EB42C3|nr:ImmA/IrrE family metallo-endopeptidase [Trueperella sp.]MCI7305459.1 ImmA/IrrE family metallo-endopeptidase [Trueperella sp.]